MPLPKVMNVRLSPAATEAVREHIRRFGTSLAVHTKLLAFRRGDDEAVPSDVVEALRILSERPAKASWLQHWGGVVGGAIFGAFLPGVANEITRSPGPHIGLLVLYISCGIVGPLIVYLTHPK